MKSLRRILRNLAADLLPPIVLRVARRAKQGRHRGLNGIDEKLQEYLDYDAGFYVELGANDGTTQSNTYYLEKNRGWKGVLVEPSPHRYFECRKSRSSENAIYCAACVSFDYTQEFVKIAYSNLMSTPIGLESDVEDPVRHALDGAGFLEAGEDVFIFGAEARTLNDLLIRSRAPRVIDFLSLDVEGAEIEVLKGIDHETFRFKYLLVECRDLPKLMRYLSPCGYEFVETLSEHDFLLRSVR